MRKMRQIKNGVIYPTAVKAAVLEAWKTGTVASKIADAHNVSEMTVRRWAHAAGLQRDLHPNVKAAMDRRWAAARAQKAASTPVMNEDGSITLNGRTYR